MLMYLLALKKRYFLSALVRYRFVLSSVEDNLTHFINTNSNNTVFLSQSGAAAILFRQTNVIWLGFVVINDLLLEFESKQDQGQKKKYDDSNRSEQGITSVCPLSISQNQHCCLICIPISIHIILCQEYYPKCQCC